MSNLDKAIQRLRDLDEHHPDWENTLLDGDLGSQMIADIVAVVRDRIYQRDREEADREAGYRWRNEYYARCRSQ